MAITLKDLTISPSCVDCEALLGDWDWAMPEPLVPVLLTVMGDVFAEGLSGSVYFVDVVGGIISQVSADSTEFQRLLRNPGFVTEKLFPSRIVRFQDAGMALPPNHVFSHKKPLVLGGEDSLDNIEAADIALHVSIHGQIHHRVKDLPEGTPVGDIRIE